MTFDLAVVTLTFKSCPGYILESLQCRKLTLMGTLVRECRCATTWCDLDLTLSNGPYLRHLFNNGWSLVGVMLNHGVTFNLGSVKVCSPCIKKIYGLPELIILCTLLNCATFIDSCTSINEFYSFIILVY